MTRLFALAGLLVVAGCHVLAGCHVPAGGSARRPVPDAPREHRLSRLALGTLVEVAVREPDAHRARRALEGAFEEIARLEALLSEWREDSEISALNRAPSGTWVALSGETLAALAAALEVAAGSDGAFDPTLLPLSRLWGFAGGTPGVPDDARIAAARSAVGWRRLELDPERGRARRLGADVAVGLGGIGKGFVADAVLEKLQREGISAALVAAGGDLAFRGGSAERPWTVAIEDPDRPGEAIAELALREGGVSTSAPTFRRFEAESEVHHHLLDPRTGRPARGVRSATVVAPNATLSDGWSTALFVLGHEAPARLADRRELAAVLLFADGTRWVSPELPVRWLVGVETGQGRRRTQPGLEQAHAHQEEQRSVVGQ